MKFYLNSFKNFGFFFRDEQIGHLARVEDHRDVFEERLILDLFVGEEEDDLLTVCAGHFKNLFEESAFKVNL